MKKILYLFMTLTATANLQEQVLFPLNNQRKNATIFTREANNKVLSQLNFTDKTSFEDAQRGFLMRLANSTISSAALPGFTIWDNARFDYQNSTCPSTVNPSLWRQAQLNNYWGLFQVTEKVYQIRSLDISTMTIIEADQGLIIIDPLMSVATAKAGIQLYYQYKANQQQQKLKIAAVIITHSHVDHYGGLAALYQFERTSDFQIYAPQGFQQASVSENVMAGTGMLRRAFFMFGAVLQYDAQGMVDCGLGKGTSLGASQFFAPNVLIGKDQTEMIIAGLKMQFLYTPETEAPVEIVFYIPDYKVLNLAEIAAQTQHNLLTPRGAQVRDGLAWAKALDKILDLYGDVAEYMIAQHNWPTWGNANIKQHLSDQRDLYKFIHDQSLYLLNNGEKPIGIANKIKLPDSLSKKWYNRGYYGTLKVNSRAVYQKYMGWYDGNPTNLDPLPTTESSQKFVEYMGGSGKVIDLAFTDFNKGNYRWVAEVMDKVVTAEPNNTQAKYLLADALEQLGYQSESGPWRNMYLQGASELRNGVTTKLSSTIGSSYAIAMEITQIFDYFSLHLNAKRADNLTMVINWNFTDDQNYVMYLQNCVLISRQQAKPNKVDISITLTKKVLALYVDNLAELKNRITIEGDASVFFSLFDQFNGNFNIMTPTPNQQMMFEIYGHEYNDFLQNE